jgi:hypothetical protein
VRLLRVAIGILVAMIAFAIFAFTSSYHDDLKKLEPYVTSETVSYYTQETPVGKPRLVVSRDLKLDGRLNIVQVRHIAATLALHSTHGFTFRTDPQVGVYVRPTLHSPVFGVTYWRELNWHEVLWVRFTHIGREAFPREPQNLF